MQLAIGSVFHQRTMAMVILIFSHWRISVNPQTVSLSTIVWPSKLNSWLSRRRSISLELLEPPMEKIEYHSQQVCLRMRINWTMTTRTYSIYRNIFSWIVCWSYLAAIFGLKIRVSVRQVRILFVSFGVCLQIINLFGELLVYI